MSRINRQTFRNHPKDLRYNSAALEDVLLGYGQEVRDIDEKIEDRDTCNGQRSSASNRAHWIVDFGQGIVRVLIAVIRPERTE